MKRKILMLILFGFLLSGCDAVYKLEYVDSTFRETLTINNLSGYEDQVKSVYSFDLSTNYEDVSDYTKEDGLAHGYKYYNKSLNEADGLILNYSYNFSEEEYNYSYIGKTVYPNLNFQNNTIYSGEISDIYVKYPALNTITIEFRTDKNVKYCNADSVVDNIYYWYLTKENSNSKKIEIILNQENSNVFDQIKDELENVEVDESINYLSIVLVGIGVIILIISMVVLIKVKNSNKK